MRTIKFKAKIECTNAWIVGLPYAVYKENDIDSIQDLITKETEYIKIDTLCEFTGVLDKNNNEIYENDILMVGNYHNELIVKYINGAFVLCDKDTNFCAISEYNTAHLLITNNIYDKTTEQ